jgi:cytochrome c
LILVAATNVAFASEELAKSKNCLACHAVDKKVVGPAYKEVKAKYEKDEKAVAMLTEKIMKGGKGNWGQIPMPPNPQVSKEEAEKLAKWVLGRK